MKTPRLIYLTGWTLLLITGAAGLGVTHLYETHFSSSEHMLISAVGQLLSLVGLCLLALSFEKKKSDGKQSDGSGAS